jgi:tetratricopeptide (TPR) repeat protein
MILVGKTKSVFVIISAVSAFVFIFYSSLVFIGDRYAAHADRVLDDPATEELDRIGLSEKTLSIYRAAISAYEKAACLAPFHAGYRSSLSDLYSRIDIWEETMRLMGSQSVDMPNSETNRWSSQYFVRQAIALDFSNVDLHLLRGQELMERGDKEQARQELLRAAALYPVNSPTRYDVAMRLFRMGFVEDARTQTAILAGNDDSYRLDDDEPLTTRMREMRTPEYESRLMNSYLYKAMELEWQIARKDILVFASALQRKGLHE